MNSISIDIDGTVSDFRTSKSDSSCLKINSVNSAGYLYNCCLLLITVIVLSIILFEFKEYVRALLMWVESQDQVVIYLIFTVLFVLVSFPFTWGYTVLVFATGYVFGIIRGLVTVLFAANIGVVVAHFAVRLVHYKFPLTKLIQNDKIQAVLSVISGSKAFRVAAFSRLTPVPFGVQNLIFAVSNINTRIYFIASFIGMIPAQVINVYLGSSLRSMEEVLSHKSTATTAIIVFFQITVGVCLMAYVLTKARQELRKALYSTSYSQVA
ncbi:transmembrane protein 64 isoform X1 [Schistocerca americana]|uniref:transmembrane protein 64 isoform X1 n=1 Tax=Schistocerca americana TaxID=7009 RepID=UPI001F4FF916|nr:transmembrane protein 64 isoform X1 [Schistocerca americana]XP_046992848.1 transmembrane protein 64 isoform X1 [Schistocerca americana]XP_047110945.1 transmembrane protein 64 isoform X1 [Schistocerca piceifrons]XP_049810521.1 transmembrane protein 64 isoform X1 [Schistocerca nitens]